MLSCSLRVVLIAACICMAAGQVKVPFEGEVELPLRGHLAFKGTVDLLKAAGLQPVPSHLEPENVPRAMRTYKDNRRGPNRWGRKSVCETEDWRKKSLKVVREIPVAGVLDDLQGETKFEASGIAQRGHNSGQYFVVFDNTRTIGELDERFQFKSNKSRLVKEDAQSPGRTNGIDDSQFEGITHLRDTDTLLVVKEEAEHGDHYHAITQEMKLSDDGASYTMIDNCTVDFELAHANKGFEGIQYHEQDGEKYLLGLCEGNFCSGGRHGRKQGNGQIVLSKYYRKDQKCGWEVQKVISVPKSAAFEDYSDMAFAPGQRGGGVRNQLAITSQENSAVWLGEFDFDKMDFVGDGAYYHFPRNDHCDQIYCNVEGVEWIDEHRLMFASDRAKADQPFICTTRDQGVHIMVLPHGHKQGETAQEAPRDEM